MIVSWCPIFQNLPWQYSECQTRADEKEKCLDKGLEPTYYFAIFNWTSNTKEYQLYACHRVKEKSLCWIKMSVIFEEPLSSKKKQPLHNQHQILYGQLGSITLQPAYNGLNTQWFLMAIVHQKLGYMPFRFWLCLDVKGMRQSDSRTLMILFVN